MTERHAHRRRWPRQLVRVECHIDGISSRASIHLTDLSLGGAYVDSSANFTMGDAVRLGMMLGGKEVIVNGHVVYTHGGMGFGLSFDVQQMPKETRERIEAFLKQSSGAS